MCFGSARLFLAEGTFHNRRSADPSLGDNLIASIGNGHILQANLLQAGLQFLRRFDFRVHDEGARLLAQHIVREADEVVVIAVAAVAADALDLSAHVIFVAEDLDDRVPAQNFAAQRVFGV